ncbi:MAG: hypothetical protein KatS3mg056_0737 [Chloroflexus sp.]|nr:MAG: hypothetical protein KatS3mg056_0737 [Chloroflexus sp.]
MNSTTLHATPCGVTACTMWGVASSHRRATRTVATRVIPGLYVLRLSVVTKIATWVMKYVQAIRSLFRGCTAQLLCPRSSLAEGMQRQRR